MFKNYFKIAFRQLARNKIFSFINIFGLAIGLTCCMLISIYIFNEMSYDSNHIKAKQIYQLGTVFIRGGKEERSPNTPAPMAKAMQQEYPEILQTTRLLKTFADDKTLLQYDTKSQGIKSFYETSGFLADSTFFKVMSYNFIEGNPATALDNPNSVVLSSEIAHKIFGTETALNKIIRISSNTNGDYNFTVTGVFLPSKIPSHIDARFFMSLAGGDMEKYIAQHTDLASNNMFNTYLLLKEGTDFRQLESKFPAFVEKYAGKDLRAFGIYKKQFLLNIRSIHLDANFSASRTSDSDTSGGSKTYLYILGCIAVFTLLIACINFMNLSTARSSKRAAEVGVRKVLGAGKSTLVRQFLGESLVMALIAFLLALVLSALLLPLFSRVAGQRIVFSFGAHGFLPVAFFGITIVTGILAGIYPAFYLSSFKPVKVLKGKTTNSLAAISLRKGLVVFQFVISVILIIASAVIVNQLRFMRNKDLGFDKEQQIIVPMRSNISKSICASLKNEIIKIAGIKSVGAAAYYPGIMHPSDLPIYKEGLTMADARRVFMNQIDEDYLQTMGIRPVAGRIFSKEYLTADTAAEEPHIILNEEAVKQMGFASAQDAAGKNVMIDWQGKRFRIRVIGVVKDFHFKDLHVPIEPYGFQLNTGNPYNYLFAHAGVGNITATLKSIEAMWHKLDPNEPFEYSFLDDDFQKNYKAGESLSAIVSYFTILAILISCLGLFGLSLFSTEQRIKEIGIRKVLGATAGSIVTLLSKDFVKLVVISIIIASPVAWWAMNKWLQDFAYRINISWKVFFLTAITALGIALLTVSFQAIKAAIANPVRSLRSE